LNVSSSLFSALYDSNDDDEDGGQGFFFRQYFCSWFNAAVAKLLDTADTAPAETWLTVVRGPMILLRFIAFSHVSVLQLFRAGMFKAVIDKLLNDLHRTSDFVIVQMSIIEGYDYEHEKMYFFVVIYEEGIRVMEFAK
jgi:hypothetical protein